MPYYHAARDRLLPSIRRHGLGDDARVNPAKLRPDPQVDHPGIWLYDGTIDVTNAVVVPIDDLL